MSEQRGRMRYAAMLGITALLACAGMRAAAAADQATKTRCAAYAQRAVKQYQLMQSHPQCVVTNDPLTWQASYDNHYNGCLLLPVSMAKLAESGRDNHLQACGGLKDAPAGGAPSAIPATGSRAAANSQGSGGSGAAIPNGPAATAGGAGTSSGGAAASSASGPTSSATNSNCQIGRPTVLPATGGVVGYGATVKDGTLSFHSSLQNGQLVTYKVVRPAYVTAQMQCTGRGENLYGQWISFTGGPQGPEIFEVDLGSSVSAAPLSPDNAMELLQK
jgi:hypothetical protein